MSVFTKEISKESFSSMISNVEGTLDAINKNWRLLCTHVKAVRERKGEITDFKSVAKKKHSATRTFYFDNQEINLKGNVYACQECGERFFVPLEALEGKDEVGRFKSFAETYLNIMELFRDMTYAETTVRGLYSGDMSLSLPGNVRGRIGEEYLYDLAGMKINTQGGVPRSDRTLQLDRALFLAHLEAQIEIYRAIVDFFNGEQTAIADDVDLGAFETAVDNDTFITPADREIPENRIQRERSSRHLDMISSKRDNRQQNTRERGSSKSSKSKKSKKDV